MTSITSIIFGAEQLLVPKVCSSRWSQACAHYASVLSVSTEKGWNKLTCSDFLGSKQPSSRTRPAVTQWDYEHAASWVDPKWRPEELCDRDEYPPVYFFQDDNAVLAQTQQLIRLLPAGQNRGAGSLWQAFCWSAGLEDPVAYMGPLPTAADTVTSQDGSSKLYNVWDWNLTNHVYSNFHNLYRHRSLTPASVHYNGLGELWRTQSARLGSG